MSKEQLIAVVDVDGTLCYTMDVVGYTTCSPRKDVIAAINKLHDEGVRVVVFTARGMRRNNGDVKKCYEQFYEITKKFLDDNGVKYDELIMGKPAGSFYFDDLSVSLDDLLMRDKLGTDFNK